MTDHARARPVPGEEMPEVGVLVLVEQRDGAVVTALLDIADMEPDTPTMWIQPGYGELTGDEMPVRWWPLPERDVVDDSRMPCVWEENSDGVWETACGGGVDENQYTYCPYCGNQIEPQKVWRISDMTDEERAQVDKRLRAALAPRRTPK